MAYFHCLASWQTARGALRRDRVNFEADTIEAARVAALARFGPRAVRALDLTLQPYRDGYTPSDFVKA